MKLLDTLADRPPAPSQMVKTILEEISGLLDQLVKAGKAGVIDLRSLPLSDHERDTLQEQLGKGEVEVRLDVAGRSEIWETSYAGVWWIRHFGNDDRIASELIEITLLPDILHSHPDDVVAAQARLALDLKEAAEFQSDQEETTEHAH